MGGSFKGKKTHYDDKAIGSTYDNPGVGKGAKGKRGAGRNASEPNAGKAVAEMLLTALPQRDMAMWVAMMRRNT